MKTSMKRETKETSVSIQLDVDKQYRSDIDTGIPFFDHMLDAFACNANIELLIEAKGDLTVDDHHTVEDVGIVLGQVFKQALKDAKLKRYGAMYIPMDEALSRVVIDLSNRPVLAYDVNFTNQTIGNFTLQNAKEFFKAFVNESRCTLHITNLYGENDHHIIESIFKAFGQAVKQAIAPQDKILSTKGVL